MDECVWVGSDGVVKERMVKEENRGNHMEKTSVCDCGLLFYEIGDERVRNCLLILHNSQFGFFVIYILLVRTNPVCPAARCKES